MDFLLTLTYKKGHRVSNPGGHSFDFLNVSINKKPIFFSEVVHSKKTPDPKIEGFRVL